MNNIYEQMSIFQQKNNIFKVTNTNAVNEKYVRNSERI